MFDHGRQLLVRCVTCACVALAVVALIGCGGSDDSLRVITAEGFDGVRADMTLFEVEDQWGRRPVLFPNYSYSGATIVTVPLCDGPVSGIAGFWTFPSVDETDEDSWKKGTLVWLWLLSGVETAEHITVGSPLTRLREVYGVRLQPVPDVFGPGNFENVFQVAGEERPGRTSLLFAVAGGEVGAIGHSRRDELGRLDEGIDTRGISEVMC